MESWTDKEAENMLDDFVASEGADDLLRLQQAIARALCRAYEGGKVGEEPDQFA